MLTKDEYLLKNFSKIKHKKWELFVITRILHLLDDPDIEYVCQQYIKVKGNKHYLTDLCFPSLKLYYEIDEGQHGAEKHLNDDKIRQREILEATDWVEKRITKSMKRTSGTTPWSIQMKVVVCKIRLASSRRGQTTC